MKWLAALLTWFAADPQAIDTERPRAAACVMAAHASMAKEKPDAPEDQNADTALGEPGAGLTTEEGRQQQADSSGTRVLQQTPQSVEAGCADGSCVAVPSVRARVLRTR